MASSRTFCHAMPMRKTTSLLALPAALFLVAGLTACQDEVPVTTTEEGSSQSQHSPNDKVDTSTEDKSSMDLDVGDCFTEIEDENSVETVPLIDCKAPHVYEVYAEGNITDSTLPVGDAMTDWGTRICVAPFKDYVGIDYYASTAYDITYLNPTPGSWANGDRTISCLITSTDGSELVGSAKNTAM